MRGTVTKKKNRWYIVYYIGKDSNGKWKQKWEGSWDTKREAERVLRSRIEEVENTFDRKADKSTLAVFLRHWLSAYCVPKLAPNTVNGYRVNVERHIIPYIGQIPLNKLTPANIQKLYADLLTSGLSGTSVRYVHNNLHRALKYAVKQELISRNPADLVDPPRIDHIEMRVLTPDESKTLISGCVDTACLGCHRIRVELAHGRQAAFFNFTGKLHGMVLLLLLRSLAKSLQSIKY